MAFSQSTTLQKLGLRQSSLLSLRRPPAQGHLPLSLEGWRRHQTIRTDPPNHVEHEAPTKNLELSAPNMLMRLADLTTSLLGKALTSTSQ